MNWLGKLENIDPPENLAKHIFCPPQPGQIAKKTIQSRSRGSLIDSDSDYESDSDSAPLSFSEAGLRSMHMYELVG